MQARQSWQETAVALFGAATARLGQDARQLGETVGWHSRIPAVDALRTHASWLNDPLRSQESATIDRPR